MPVASKYGPGTLPDHDRCTMHKKYKLGCAQFEQLISRSGQRCEICGDAGDSGRTGKLHIDHDAIAPEPDCGSVILDQYEATWMREGDGLWRPCGRKRPGISSADWQWLYRLRGPHNLAPVNLYAPPETRNGRGWDWLIERAERAALQALLSEHSGKNVPLYATEAYGRLLVAYMDGEYEPRLPWARDGYSGRLIRSTYNPQTGER